MLSASWKKRIHGKHGNASYYSDFKRKCTEANAARPNEKWSTDVTEFKIPGTGKKLYLSAIFDLYDRFPVAYAVSGRNDNKLVFDTYDRALKENPDANPVFHSDRGYQYTSRVFREMLQKQGMEQSV